VQCFQINTEIEDLKIATNQIKIVVQRKAPFPLHVALQRRSKQGTIALQNPAMFSKQ